MPSRYKRARGRAWFGLLVAAAVAATAVTGCVRHLYPGPRRPDDKTIMVESQGLVILAIDGRRVRGSSFRLLPGTHWFSIQLRHHFEFYDRISHGSQSLCFEGWPGHTYVLEPAYRGHKWWPEAFDDNGTAPFSCDGATSAEP